MTQLTGFSLVIAAVTMIGSVLSAIGSGFIIICYLFLPLKYHFRHVLILNLAVADFLDAVTASAGGIYILVHKKYLEDGPACTFQGLAMQVTVQATDCAILAIAVLTVHFVTRQSVPKENDKWRTYEIILSCSAIWALPLFTGFFSLGMGWYAPATGNWCWIKAKPIYLRYALTHGWRFLFILTEICLYVYLHIWIRGYYKRISSYSGSSEGSRRTFIVTEVGAESYAEPQLDSITGLQKPGSSPSSETWTLTQTSGGQRSHPIPSSGGNIARYQAIQKMLLLNAYPLAYIILWIPGIANRLIEATGHTSKVMQLMQASTQLVGLANALTYGWNERVATQIRERFFQKSNRPQRKRSEGP